MSQGRCPRTPMSFLKKAQPKTSVRLRRKDGQTTILRREPIKMSEKNIIFTAKLLFCNLVADGKQRLS